MNFIPLFIIVKLDQERNDFNIWLKYFLSYFIVFANEKTELQFNFNIFMKFTFVYWL